LLRDKIVQESTLTFTGHTGDYGAALARPAQGRYTVRFVAADAKTLNAGVSTLKVDIKGR
jgi:hypothetical protein